VVVIRGAVYPCSATGAIGTIVVSTVNCAVNFVLALRDYLSFKNDGYVFVQKNTGWFEITAVKFMLS
jgi:hypothetical protein